MTSFSLVTLLVLCSFSYATCIPDRGKWEYNFTEKSVGISRSLFKGSKIKITISCTNDKNAVRVQGVLRKIKCWNLFIQNSDVGELQTEDWAKASPYKEYQCGPGDIIPDNIEFRDENSKPQLLSPNSTVLGKPNSIQKDGVYLLVVRIDPVPLSVEGKIDIEIRGPAGGYLSAAEWPLLNFYGVMCLVYVLYCFMWLTISFLQWRDLLRIQFWIGAVVLIGLIEKALFYEEYSSVNRTGESSFLGTVFVAELVSVAKRSLARILVIIVSLGYGIVKPRLGSHFPKIIAVGIIYFVLASIEAYLRVIGPKNGPSDYLLFASIPLALVDSLICWWIFSSLVQTTRTLRLRRNLVKLTLYNRFTNTLILAVIASTIFMLYSIKTHRITNCLEDWDLLWIDDAFWHILFSVILLVIMVLWRPTNNNQRYAFSPLLDAPDDEDDDEEVEHFVNDAYGVKMRGVGSNRSDSPKQRSNLDDDLKWVEENIPPSLMDSNLPVLDSDEELINTRFEISKME